MHFRLDNLIINYLKDKTLWKLLHVSKSSCRCTLTSTPTATSGRARTAASTTATTFASTVAHTRLEAVPDTWREEPPEDGGLLHTPSHPCPCPTLFSRRSAGAVVFFFPNQPSPTASTFRSGAPCAARTFLPSPFAKGPAADRSSAFALQRYEDAAKSKRKSSW